VEATVATPLFSLHGIKRVKLAPGKSEVVSFPINSEMLALINDKGESVLESGKFTVSIGGSLPGSRSKTLGAAEGQQITLTLK
jgi:beta-glucosidase